MLLKNIFNVIHQRYVLTDEDWVRVENYAASTSTTQLDYGKIKNSNSSNPSVHQPDKSSSADVEKNTIKDIKIRNFFGLGEISDVEKALVEVGYNRERFNKKSSKPSISPLLR